DKGKAGRGDHDEDALFGIEDAPGLCASLSHVAGCVRRGLGDRACDHPVEVDGYQEDDAHKEERGGIRAAFIVSGLDFKPVSDGDELLKAEIGKPRKPISELGKKADRRPGEHHAAPKPKKKAPAI